MPRDCEREQAIDKAESLGLRNGVNDFNAKMLFCDFDTNFIFSTDNFKRFSLADVPELSFKEWMGYKEELPDQSLVVCFDYRGATYTELGFYDKKNGCIYHPNGERYGDSYDNYQQINIDELPLSLKAWAIEAQKKLEE